MRSKIAGHSYYAMGADESPNRTRYDCALSPMAFQRWPGLLFRMAPQNSSISDFSTTAVFLKTNFTPIGNRRFTGTTWKSSKGGGGAPEVVGWDLADAIWDRRLT